MKESTKERWDTIPSEMGDAIMRCAEAYKAIRAIDVQEGCGQKELLAHAAADTLVYALGLAFPDGGSGSCEQGCILFADILGWLGCGDVAEYLDDGGLAWTE